jgi:hypothetical protein
VDPWAIAYGYRLDAERRDLEPDPLQTPLLEEVFDRLAATTVSDRIELQTRVEPYARYKVSLPVDRAAGLFRVDGSVGRVTRFALTPVYNARARAR